MARLVKPLSDKEIKTAEPREKEYKLSDGKGLFIVVKIDGTKYFRFDFSYIDDFIQNNTPKKKISVFDEHIDDINKLIELNYSQKQVIEFLKAKCKNKKGLSEANLSKYLKKFIDKSEVKQKNISPVIVKENDIAEVKESSTEEDLLNLVGNFKKAGHR